MTPVDAAARAAQGISNAPGTSKISIASAAAPATVRASTAPSRSRVVMSALKRDTISATRSARASGSGASTAGSVG